MKLDASLQGELDQQEQAYLNSLLQEENQSIAKLIKRSASPNNDVVEQYLLNSIDKIQRQLDGGTLELAQGSSKPIGKSKERMMEIELKKKMLEKELGYLDTQIRSYSGQVHEDAAPVGHELPKEVHKKLIKKMFKLHHQYEQLHHRNLLQMEQKQKEEQQKKKAESDDQKKKEQEQKRRRIEESMKLIRDQQEKRRNLLEESNARIEQVKQKKFLHQRMEERYQKEVVLPTLELKKKKLKEIREFRRPLSIEELKSHEQQYSKRKAQLAHERKHDIPKYEPPAKSSRLEKLLEQEQLQKQKVEQDKKRQLQQKLERAESYCLYLKENFKPRVDEEKKREIEERLQKEKSKSKEDRINTKMIGLGYLEYCKQRHKIVSREQRNGTPLETRNLSHREHTAQAANLSYQSKTTSVKPHNYLTTRDKREYDEQRKRKLERIIDNKEMNKADKVKELKAHAELLTEMANRKNQLLKIKPSEQNESQATELLLASIRAKMGIIDIYKVDKE